MLFTNLFTGLGLNHSFAWVISQFLSILIFDVVLLVLIAYLLLADRKIWAAVQMRRGPNVVGPFGLLQTFADLFKFLFKEVIIPAGANKVIFMIAPLITVTLAFAGWAVVPLADHWVVADINVGILYLFAMSSLGVYGIIMAGWASNSKYPFLSALRAAAQMVSYEVSIGFVIITVLLFAGSLNLSEIVRAQAGNTLFSWNWCSILFPMLPIFFVSALAETNRPPFDLVEAESELVAGFFVEYSSTPFLLFFLGEYLSIVLMCAMCSILFLGGWLPPLNFWVFAPFVQMVPGPIWFAAKIAFVLFFFIWARAALPRYRYDQLMRLGWKVFLPLTLIWLVLTAGVLEAFGWLPKTGL